MKKTFKSLISIILVCATICSYTLAFDSTYGIPRASDFLSSYDAWINTTSNGILLINFDLDATTTMTRLGTSEIVVQKKLSNGNWLGIQSYYGINTPSMVGYDRGEYGNTITFNGAPGTEYRAKVTFFAENSKGSDFRTVYTTSVIAK